jgi:hypothetical protein
MNASEILTPETRRWLERKSEVMHDFILPQIEKLPADTAEVILHLLNRAQAAEESAGRSGEKHDGGAGNQLTAIEMFVHGWYQKLPREWQPLASQIKAQRDPEYAEYQRLKKKFEGAR